MSRHLTVDVYDGLKRLLHRFIALDALQKGAVITRHADFIELLQVGGVDGRNLIRSYMGSRSPSLPEEPGGKRRAS